MMLDNLGLSSMDNSGFDPCIADEKIERMMNCAYEPNGANGALFVVQPSIRRLQNNGNLLSDECIRL